MILLIMLYLLVGASTCGTNYYVMQDRLYQRGFDEFDRVAGSIGIGIFWPLCIGIVAARVYQYIQKYK